MHKKISFIGSGNVATYLATSFYKTKCKINQVYSKNQEHAKNLANKVDAEICLSIDELEIDVDFIIIAVNDSSIIEVSKKIQKCSATIIHCAGSQSIEILNGNSANYGVLYPLQTFSKNNIPTHLNFPFFVEGNNTPTTNSIIELAKFISNNIHQANSQQRKTLHLAAVFTNNFINHLLGISKTILEKENLSIEDLQPLLMETILKAQNNNPFEIQTGPAKRNDEVTLAMHNEILKQYNPNFYLIYTAITKSIQENLR